MKSEIDEEGSTLDLAESRLKTEAGDGKLFAMSKPKKKGTAFHKRWCKGTRSVRLLPCPCCGTHQELSFFGESATDYQSVYMAFQQEGLDVFSPSPMTARIKRRARIEMVNRLLGGSADTPGLPRLVIAQDERGVIAAPKLVDALESLKKKAGDDDPEGSQRKDEADKTHAPAALSDLLWPFEQEAFTAQTVKIAIAEARRG